MNTIKEFELVREWAKERGLYDKGDVKTQFVKLAEEFGEVANAIVKSDEKEFKDGLGDMLVVMINLAHIGNTSMEECLELAYNEIKNRQGSMINGSFVKNKSVIENDEFYMCKGLIEFKCTSWSEHFIIGKDYKLNKEENTEGADILCLFTDDNKCFYVDSSQFELLPF